MKRILIVNDGTAWFVRQVRITEHDLSRDEKVYRCDRHVGGPLATLDEAAGLVKALLAGCTCTAGSHTQSSVHKKGCKLKF